MRTEEIDCDFTRLDGFLFLGGDDEPALLDQELEAAHRAGLTEVTRVEQIPGRGKTLGPALRFPRQGRFHVLKYLAGLARAIEARGGKIFCGTRVEKIEGGSPAMVTTSTQNTVAADHVVVCTNGPISDMVVTHTKMAPYRTFVVAFEVPKGSISDALYWDTLHPYHYVRLQRLDDARDALIVGGEDHKTAHHDDAAKRFENLETWTRERFASAGARIAQWSGQVLETNDYLAFIGKNPDGAEHVWLATGDSGHGDDARHDRRPVALRRCSRARRTRGRRSSTRSASRCTRASSATLAKEAADVALQFGDYVTPGQVDDVASIPAGEGRVIRRGAHKVAVYKDDAGRVHERSAACTHVKCIVDWNTRGEELGLPVPRIALRSVRQGAQRASDRRPPPSAVESQTRRSCARRGAMSQKTSSVSSRAASSDGM